MKKLTFEEYDDLMAFLAPKFKIIWEHENEERAKVGKSLDYFQFGFSKFDCFHYCLEGDHDFYLIYNTGFLRVIREQLLEALEKFPDYFGTGNADDVLDALYQTSNYRMWGKIDDYVQYLIDNCCAYVVYRENGEWGDVLRIDMLRKLDISKENPDFHDFTGGLLHTLKHFSINGRNLSVDNYIHDIFDIQYLIYLIAMAFRLRTCNGKSYKSVQVLSDCTMLGSFYHNPITGIFHLNSYYKRSSKH